MTTGEEILKACIAERLIFVANPDPDFDHVLTFTPHAAERIDKIISKWDNERLAQATRLLELWDHFQERVFGTVLEGLPNLGERTKRFLASLPAPTLAVSVNLPKEERVPEGSKQP